MDGQVTAHDLFERAIRLTDPLAIEFGEPSGQNHAHEAGLYHLIYL